MEKSTTHAGIIIGDSTGIIHIDTTLWTTQAQLAKKLKLTRNTLNNRVRRYIKKGALPDIYIPALDLRLIPNVNNINELRDWQKNNKKVAKKFVGIANGCIFDIQIANKMETSNNFLAMRKDGKQCIAYQTKFAKAIGDKVNINGADYYVFSLESSLFAAQARNAGMGFANNLSLAKRVLPNIFK